jgi:hypothetical protein
MDPSTWTEELWDNLQNASERLSSLLKQAQRAPAMRDNKAWQSFLKVHITTISHFADKKE